MISFYFIFQSVFIYFNFQMYLFFRKITVSGISQLHLSNVPYDYRIADFITVSRTKEPLILRVTYCTGNKALPRVFGFYREPLNRGNPNAVASRTRAGHANLSKLRLTVVC